MTDKELLLKDLCARLPYGVMVTHKLNINVCGLVSDIDRFGNSYVQHHGILKIDEIKPYLRSLSSMTEEEKEVRRQLKHDLIYQGGDAIEIYMNRYINWLDSRYFDWRMDDNNETLIKKGLALEAPEGMYNLTA